MDPDPKHLGAILETFPLSSIKMESYTFSKVTSSPAISNRDRSVTENFQIEKKRRYGYAEMVYHFLACTGIFYRLEDLN